MLGWLSKASGNDSLSLGKSQKSAPVTATISGPFDVQTHASLIMGLRGWGNCAVGIVEITQWLAKLQKISGLYSFKSEHTFWWHCSWSYRYGTIFSENARRCKDKADVSVLRPQKIVAKKPKNALSSRGTNVCDGINVCKSFLHDSRRRIGRVVAETSGFPLHLLASWRNFRFTSAHPDSCSFTAHQSFCFFKLSLEWVSEWK